MELPPSDVSIHGAGLKPQTKTFGAIATILPAAWPARPDSPSQLRRKRALGHCMRSCIPTRCVSSPAGSAAAASWRKDIKAQAIYAEVYRAAGWHCARADSK
jgi:hypothetical protein